jgi:hypothetical protein
MSAAAGRKNSIRWKCVLQRVYRYHSESAEFEHLESDLMAKEKTFSMQNTTRKERKKKAPKHPQMTYIDIL